MAPFLNVLGRKPNAPTGLKGDGSNQRGRASTNGAPYDNEQKSDMNGSNEFKLSGTLFALTPYPYLATQL